MTWFKQLNSDYNPKLIPPLVKRVFDSTSAFESECRYFHVESSYYDWDYEQRAKRLNAPTIDHLCKSLLFKNTKWKPRTSEDTSLGFEHPEFILVIVQYTDKISSKKLNMAMKERMGNSQGIKAFNMRIAHEDEAVRLTGYGNNAVSPFGMTEKVPIIVTEKIAKLNPPFLFLGCGHVDWKICAPVASLVDNLNATIIDLSE